MDGVVFAAPGPGSWELETTHAQRPVARFDVASLGAFAEGMAEGAARYGLLFDHFEPALVNGFIYSKVVPFEADGTAGPEVMRDRIATSVRAFETKQWRADLERWDTVDRPAAVAANRDLQRVDPAQLSDEELATHLRRCLVHVCEMTGLHQRYSVAATLAIGEFMALAQDWTGVAPQELAALLRGTTPISAGFATSELDALAAAVRASASATAILSATTPAADTLEALAADPEAGSTARAYLDAVRWRSVGYDVADATVGEMPELLVGVVRAAVEGAGAARVDDASLATVRGKVPEQHREAFDAALQEARVVNRLRDERAVYADGWATGLARRAVLEAGRRLQAAGRLADLQHAVDADVDELTALLRGEAGPDPGEIAGRYTWRTTHTIEDAPPQLGDPPTPPPPLDALPPPARRAARAVDAALAGMFAVADTPNTPRVLHGIAVNDGVYEGPARLVDDSSDFGRVQRGDVLVARNTSPYFNVVLPLLGAIVTDRGGQLCHAAIVAREYGIPGIVGTREATRRIPDGARVRVDGTTGEVRLLE